MCHLQYTNLYYFPCPDTNGSLIHNFPPYINEKIFNEILIIKPNNNGEYIHSRKLISNRTYRGSFDVL